MNISHTILLLSLYITFTAQIELGQNLIVNSKFRYPDLISNNINLKFYPAPNFIPGWKCTTNCELDNCRRQAPIYLGIKILYGNCTEQVLDLSSNKIQSATQIFQAEQGAHNLNVEFLIPFYFANKKTLIIYFNGQIIYRYKPLVKQDYFSRYFEGTIYTTVGSNNLTFTMTGLSDSYGFRLVSVEVRKIMDTTIESIIQNTITNKFTTNIIALPASRVIFGQLISPLVSLDRLQLYYYHNRNYSHYATLLLKSISNLLSTKGEFSLQLQKKILGSVGEIQQNFISQLDYKQKYISINVLDKSHDGFGFLTNNSNLFVYSFPFFIVFISLFYLFFRLTFNVKFSKFFRKYSFIGIIIFQMIFEGNIEQYTFYILGELNTFFSINLKHKIVNTFIVFFFFLLCFYSVGIYFWCWRCYRKNIKYFTENVNDKFIGILGYTVGNGIMCMVFGAVHQLLLNSPNLQIFVLMGTQIIWILLQLWLINLKAYKAKTTMCLFIIEGLLRMSFQLSIFLFDKSTSNPFDSSFINSQVHLRQVFLFIFLWIIQIIISILFCLKELLDIFKIRRIENLNIRKKLKHKQIQGNKKMNKEIKNNPFNFNNKLSM